MSGEVGVRIAVDFGGGGCIVTIGKPQASPVPCICLPILSHHPEDRTHHRRHRHSPPRPRPPPPHHQHDYAPLPAWCVLEPAPQVGGQLLAVNVQHLGICGGEGIGCSTTTAVAGHISSWGSEVEGFLHRQHHGVRLAPGCRCTAPPHQGDARGQHEDRERGSAVEGVIKSIPTTWIHIVTT